MPPFISIVQGLPAPQKCHLQGFKLALISVLQVEAAKRSSIHDILNTIKTFFVAHAATIAGVGAALALIVLIILFPGFFIAGLLSIFGILGTAIMALALGVAQILQLLGRSILDLLGFGLQGVTAGSVAALCQAVIYAGNVTAGSLFSSLQSLGALCGR